MRSLALATSIGLIVCGCSSGPYEFDEKSYSQPPFIGTPVPSDITKIHFHGSVYYRLTGPKLRQAIVGKSIFNDTSGPDPVIVSGDGQYFASDGCGYARNRDRVGPAFGQYRVKEDRVCTKVGGADGQSCFALFQNREGRWLYHGLSGPSVPGVVVLKTDDRYGGSCTLVDPF